MTRIADFCCWRRFRVRGSGTGSVRRPNIVLIVSDDQGYAEMSGQGGTCRRLIWTGWRDGNPVHRRIRHVAVLQSEPRGALTGRYQQRFGHENNPSSG
jgi:arylsulfatase A-like enzyme